MSDGQFPCAAGADGADCSSCTPLASPQNQDPQCRHGFLETSSFFEGLRAPYMAPYIAPYIAPYMAPYIAPYMAPIYIAPYGAL